MATAHRTRMTVEHWLPIEGYEGLYEVSDLGRVRGMDRIDGQGRQWHGRILVASGPTYPTVKLHSNDDGRTYRVHVLVMRAFGGTQPEGTEVCHNDGNSLNNAIANLRWGTRQENSDDKFRHGTNRTATVSHCKRGHPLASPNLVAAPARRGERQCLACDRARGDKKRSGGTGISQERADHHYRLIQRAE